MTYVNKALTATMDNPVVIASAPTLNDEGEGIVDIQKVNNDSYQIRFKEWNYLDNQHAFESVDIMAFESGNYTLADGTKIEVGLRNIATNDIGGGLEFKDINFKASANDIPFFGNQTPYLFVTQQTRNGGEINGLRINNLTPTSFKVSLSEQDSLQNNGHTNEKVGYVAILPPAGQKYGEISIDGVNFYYHVDRVSINSDFTDLNNGYQVQFDEEQSVDSETGHTVEIAQVLYIADHVFVQDITTRGTDNGSLRIKRKESDLVTLAVNHELTTHEFSSSHSAPIIFTSPATLNDNAPGVVDIRNVTLTGPTSCEVNFSEWNYLDGVHDYEVIDMLALNSGVVTAPDGTKLEANTVSIDAGAMGELDFKQVLFAQSHFTTPPYVFLKQQTRNGGDINALRVRNVTRTGFEVALSEEQAKGFNGHISEDVAYFAIEPPKGQKHGIAQMYGGDYYYNVDKKSVNHELRLINNDYQIKFDEEQSHDAEIGHLGEMVNLLYIGNSIFSQVETTNGTDNGSLRIK